MTSKFSIADVRYYIDMLREALGVEPTAADLLNCLEGREMAESHHRYAVRKFGKDPFTNYGQVVMENSMGSKLSNGLYLETVRLSSGKFRHHVY